MLSFKYFLIEQSSRLIPRGKFWFKSGGGFVSLNDGIHHVKAVVDEPHKFDMTIQDIHDMKPIKSIKEISSGYSWDDNIITGMNKKGHFRGLYSHKPAHTSNGELYPTEHKFELEDDRSWKQNYSHKDLSEFHDHMNHLLKIVPNSDNFSLELSFIKNFNPEYIEKLKNKHKVQITASGLLFPNRNSLSSYLNDRMAKSVRHSNIDNKDVSSTDVRAALGKNKPDNLTTAEWNFFRTIGDSYISNNVNKTILEIINPIGSNRPVNDPKKPKPKIPPVTATSREEPIDRFTPGQTPQRDGTYKKPKKP